MKKVALLVMAALALMAFSSVGATFAQSHGKEVVFNMMEENNSGESGTVTMTEGTDGTTVVVDLKNGTSTPQPAHFHAGSCADLDPTPLAPLADVVNGKSENLISATIDQVFQISDQAGLAINVHKSKAEADVYVSCGDIVQSNVVSGGMQGGGMMPGGMPTTGNGGSTLPMIAFALVAVALMGAGLKLSRNKA